MVRQKNLSLDDEFRTRAVIYFALSLVIWAPVYSFLMYGLAPHIEVVISTMICMVLVGISPLLLRWGASFWFVGNWLAFNVYWEMLFVGAYAGYGPPPFYWLTVLPLLALVIAGLKSAVFWLVMTMISMAAYYFLLSEGSAPELVLTSQGQLVFEASVLAGLYVLVMLLATGYEKVKVGALAQLRASEERERSIVENAADGILTVDANGIIQSINQAGCRIFDGRDEDMTGMALQELVPHPQEDSSSDSGATSSSRAADGGRPFLRQWSGRRYESEARRGERESVPVELAVDRLDLAEDERYVVVVRDLSDRKKVEAQQQRDLQRSKESFRALIENLPDAVIVHHQGTIVYLNPAAGQILDHDSFEQLVGQPISRLISTEDWDEFKTSMEESIQGGAVRFIEHQLVAEGGVEIPVESTTFQAAFQNQLAMITIARNLTRRKKMRAQMMQMERMSAVGTLAAGVAHEINNPLTFVHGNLQYVAEEIQLAFEESQQQRSDDDGSRSRLLGDWSQSLQDAQQGAERIARIVSDLGTYSKRRSREITSVDVEEVIESTISLAHGELKHRARVVREFTEVSVVRADETSLGQILLNLLINAAHSIEGQVDNNEIRIVLSQDEDFVKIVVRDTGTGIREEVIHQIFDPFYTTKSVDQGTGLGLSICRNIVQELGGEITVESEEGVGTAFTVLLPRPELLEERSEGPPSEKKISAKALPPRNISSDEGSIQIMVIDDEPLVTKTLYRMLGAEYSLTDFQEATVALEALRQGNSFDVILCDLMMPGMSGMEFFEQLQLESPRDAQRVLFMTGGAVTKGASHFLESTNAVILEKPFPGEDIRKHIHDIILRSEGLH